MNGKFTEQKLHDKLWNYLTELYPEDCLARNWKGWSYRVGKEKREKTFFYREFDIARFHREKNRYTTELLEETNLSLMGLNRHLRELENLGWIKRTRINNKRVYAIQEIPAVEELIVDALINYLGQFTAIRLLEARVRGEKEVHIDDFYDVKGFLKKFTEENFPKLRSINYKALLEAFRERYGEPIL